MSTTNQRGSPLSLPTAYWVNNEWPGKSTKDGKRSEFTDIAKKVDSSAEYGAYSWYRFSNGKHDTDSASKPTDTTPIIDYQTWKAAVTGEVTGDYKVEAIKDGNWAIHCNTAEEYSQIVTLMDTAGKGTMNSTSGGWDQYGNKVHVMTQDYPCYGTNRTNPTPVIEAKDVIASNSIPVQPQQGYQVGDWIVPVVDSNITGYKLGASDLIKGQLYQIEKIKESDKHGQYVQVKGPIANCILTTDIRPATKQEIDKTQGKVEQVDAAGKWRAGDRVKRIICSGVNAAVGDTGTVTSIHGQGTKLMVQWDKGVHEGCDMKYAERVGAVQGWKVGDKLVENWLRTQEVFYKWKGTSEGKSCCIGDREVKELREGWALISGTNDIWLPPKQQQTTPVQEGTNIGRKVRIVNWNAKKQYEGQIGIVEDTDWNRKEGISQTVVCIKMSDGQILNPYTPLASWPQCEWVTEVSTANIPVTKDNAYIGMKVVRYDEVKRRSNKPDQVGVITNANYDNGKGISVKWEGKNYDNDYTWGNIAIAPEVSTISETKSITNNQKSTNNVNDKQKYTEGTAVNLSANPSTVCRADRRTATPVRQSGQSIIIIRGHRGHSKAVRVN